MAKKKRRTKRRYLGAMGKFGAFMLAVPPLIGSVIEGATAATARTFAGYTPSMASRLNVFWRMFVNSMAKGFGMPEPFGTTNFKDINGGSHAFPTYAVDIPQGVWWITTAIGGLALAQDRITAMVLKRPVRMPVIGNLTGSK